MTVQTSSGEVALRDRGGDQEPSPPLLPGDSGWGYHGTFVFCRKPVVCGVSSLGIDHTSLLGDTMEKIAWQKGGIFKVTRKAGGREVHRKLKKAGLGLNH
jgi:hypothetical protein